MKTKTVKYLPSGWEDDSFEVKLQQTIYDGAKEGLSYYDIKISSKGNHCMVIFEK